VRAYSPVLSAGDRLPVERLSLILTISDQLERRSAGSDGVPQVRLRDRRRAVVLRLGGGCGGWQPTDIARRFKRAFGRDLGVDVDSGAR
jgi:hypothetical protein